MDKNDGNVFVIKGILERDDGILEDFKIFADTVHGKKILIRMDHNKIFSNGLGALILLFKIAFKNKCPLCVLASHSFVYNLIQELFGKIVSVANNKESCVYTVPFVKGA